MVLKGQVNVSWLRTVGSLMGVAPGLPNTDLSPCYANTRIVGRLGALLCWMCGKLSQVVTIGEIREIAGRLPRSYEALVQDRVKFRVGKIVYVAFSRDEQVMGFAFPKEERAALVASDPNKFLMPLQADMRYNWVRVRLAAIDHDEALELVLEAWRLVVPKRVGAAFGPG